MPIPSEGSDPAELTDRLAQLERRLSLIEKRLEIDQESPLESRPPESAAEDAEHREEDLENRIGENWFPRVGITVLVIGLVFLLTFPFQGLPAALPSLFGYLLVGGAIGLSRHWRNSFPGMSRYVRAGALVLLYFTTLRLYFFSTDPPITDIRIEVILLLFVVVVTIFASLRAHSQFLVALSLTTGFITALISGDPWIVIPVNTVLALATVAIARRHMWPALLLYGTVLTYVTHLLWVLNDPVVGNPVALMPPTPANTLPILLYAVIFAAGTLFRRDPVKEQGIVITNSFVNALASGGLYLIVTAARGGDALALYQTIASGLFLCIAIAFWQKEESKYSTFFYAMLGYLALSVAMIALFNRPDYFIWLAWQSLLVVSTAVWFRSQFIVITNFVIYIILFAAYALLVDSVHVVSLSFGIVAIASARILNWQKARLALKTEMMRNAYLACAFFIFPFALYHALPRGYVSISWVVVALFYYAMSILVKSRKYRWMAFLTLLLTFGHVLLVDSVTLEPAYRILSFLVLGAVLFWISLKYAKKRARGASPEVPHELHN
jgi:uncharacterized membrane protein